MVGRLPSGGDIGRIFPQMGAKTESTKDKVVNFFRAQTKDSAPVPRLLSAIKEAKANIPTFDSFHASMRLDNDSLKALKNQAGDFAAIASSALSSVKTALSNLVNSSREQLEAQDKIQSNNPLYTTGNAEAQLQEKFAAIRIKDPKDPKFTGSIRAPLLRFTPTDDPNKFQAHSIEMNKDKKIQMMMREITINQNGKYSMVMDGKEKEFDKLEGIIYEINGKMPTTEQIRSA